MRFSGRSILVVEDDPVVSTDLCLLLEDEGASILGPCRRTRESLAVLDRRMPDAAILDIDLLDEDSFPVATRLGAAGVPFLFYSAKDCPAFPTAKATAAPILSKAHTSRAALDLLAELTLR